MDHILLAAHSIEAALEFYRGTLGLKAEGLEEYRAGKWVRGLQLMPKDRTSFWEQAGYHNHGNPWTEERQWAD